MRLNFHPCSIKVLSAVTVIAAGIFSSAMAAQIAPDRDHYTIRITGRIEKGDLQRLVSVSASQGNFPKYVTLNSPGGDVMEAMRMGRFIRETLTDTFVASECASACVLVFLAGATQSSLDGARIGVHSPYFDKQYFAGLNRAEAEGKYRALQASTRQYLLEMDVPTWLIDRMFSVPSDDIYFLSVAERKALRASPPALAEWFRARCNPPSAEEQRRFNIFDEPSPSRPDYREFQSFKSRFDNALKCEEALRREARATALKAYR